MLDLKNNGVADSIVSFVTIRDGRRDNCSENSYWVRQFLEWCDYEGVVTDQNVRPLASGVDEVVEA